MTTRDMIKHISRNTGLSPKEAKEILTIVLSGIQSALIAGVPCKLAGFGTFHTKLRKSYMGRNPYTGDSMEIHGSRMIRFSPGKGLKAMVKEGAR